MKYIMIDKFTSKPKFIATLSAQGDRYRAIQIPNSFLYTKVLNTDISQYKTNNLGHKLYVAYKDANNIYHPKQIPNTIEEEITKFKMNGGLFKEYSLVVETIAGSRIINTEQLQRISNFTIANIKTAKRSSLLSENITYNYVDIEELDDPETDSVWNSINSDAFTSGIFKVKIRASSSIQTSSRSLSITPTNIKPFADISEGLTIEISFDGGVLWQEIILDEDNAISSSSSDVIWKFTNSESIDNLEVRSFGFLYK